MTKVLNHITTVLVVLIVLLAILLVGFRFIGFDTYIVLSGSMEPAHKTGALIYARDTDPQEVEIGDVITFRSSGSETIVTHRVIDITDGETGREFTTKGDANEDADAQPVPASNVIGKVAFSIPYMGSVANYIQNPPGLYFAAGAGVILIVLMFLTDALIEDEKKAKKKTKKKAKRNNQEEAININQSNEQGE